MGYGRMARSGPLRYATSMPFPGPIPETPWKLLPPQEGLPYFPYMRKGTPSTYGDTSDGGNAPAYDILPAVLTGLPAVGLVWAAGKYGRVGVGGRDYAMAFCLAAGSRLLFDTFGLQMLKYGPIEGIKHEFTTEPRRALSMIALAVGAPIAVAKMPIPRDNRRNPRRNRRNRR